MFVTSNDDIAATEASTETAAGSASQQQHQHHPQQQWSDDEIESLLLTIILFGVLTFLIYSFVIKPVLQPANNNNAQQQQGVNNDAVAFQRQRYNQQQQQRRMDQFNTDANTNDDVQPDGELYALLKSLARVPPHISPTSSSKITSLILSDGVVPFRYTHASSFEKNTSSSTNDDLVPQNRRERAKIFAKLFRPPSTTSSNTTDTSSSTAAAAAAGAPPPPLRGANVIITIKLSDISSTKIHSILYLLGTYYNLFVMLSLPTSFLRTSGNGNESKNDLEEEKRELELIEGYKSKLLQSLPSSSDSSSSTTTTTTTTKVPTMVIPPHRIIASTSALGRIAFVRQLGKKGAELILDYDLEVKTQLNRFGFTVLLYPEFGDVEKKVGGDGEESFSGLGDMLLP